MFVIRLIGLILKKQRFYKAKIIRLIMIRAGIDLLIRKSAHLSSLGSRLIANRRDEFTYVSPIPEDRDQDVVVHVRNFFYVDEPMNKSIGLSTKGKPHKELDEMTLNLLSHRLTVMAVDKATDKLAAVILNLVEFPSTLAEEKKWAETITCAKFQKIITLLNTIKESLNLHQKYNVDKICDIALLSIDSDFRGKGLSAVLVKMSEDIARKNNIKVIKGECTGAFSQKILVSAGYESVYELKYADYLDDNKQQIFKVKPPDESVKVLVKVLK